MELRKFRYFVEELWLGFAGALFFSAMALWLVPDFYHDASGEAGLDSNARPTIATVIRSGKNAIYSHSGIYRIPYTTCGVIYRYMVSGKSYTNQIRGCEYAENHPERSKIKIYYNMKSPEHTSILQSNSSRKPIVILSYIILIPAFIILPLLVWLGLYKRTKRIAVRYDELYEW